VVSPIKGRTRLRGRRFARDHSSPAFDANWPFVGNWPFVAKWPLDGGSAARGRARGTDPAPRSTGRGIRASPAAYRLGASHHTTKETIVLEVIGLTRRFGDHVAVDDVSFTVPAG
jgi:hypothetical protein